MTRLTADLIEGVPSDKINLDSLLLSATGRNMREIALEAAGLDGTGIDLSAYTVSVVPITSGLGIIGGFSDSVSAIVKRLGMDSEVTSNTDVAGFSEGVERGSDIIMMADDKRFVAYNTRCNRFTDNAYGTAMGYSVVLRDAARGLDGKDVLVIGAGFVGSHAVRILKDMGANVTVTDIIREKGERLVAKYGVKFEPSMEKGLADHTLVLNAAPVIIPGELISDGTIFSTPGVPHYFDSEGRRRAKFIIHDPLEIGTAVMAVNSAGFSFRQERN